MSFVAGRSLCEETVESDTPVWDNVVVSLIPCHINDQTRAPSIIAVCCKASSNKNRAICPAILHASDTLAVNMGKEFQWTRRFEGLLRFIAGDFSADREKSFQKQNQEDIWVRTTVLLEMCVT